MRSFYFFLFVIVFSCLGLAAVSSTSQSQIFVEDDSLAGSDSVGVSAGDRLDFLLVLLILVAALFFAYYFYKYSKKKKSEKKASVAKKPKRATKGKKSGVKKKAKKK